MAARGRTEKGRDQRRTLWSLALAGLLSCASLLGFGTTANNALGSDKGDKETIVSTAAVTV